MSAASRAPGARWEVRAAWIVGVLLPLLESARRRTDFSELAFYVDDWIAGLLLLGAAYATSSGRRWGRAALAAAWGILCGGLYGSFFGQLRYLGQDDISGLPSSVVAAIKGALFAVAIAATIAAIRRASPPEPA